jgi:ubiquinone/menaquinone biosynthesis C-methylase UbiE
MASSAQTTTSSSPSKTSFDPSSHFEKVASTYEQTSTVMKEIASHLLNLSPPLTPDSVIHDNAAGPGIITGEILRLPQYSQGSFPTIYATDYSPAMIRALEARAARDGWPSHVVKAQVMNSMDLSAFADNTFTHTYMAAAIFLIPNPIQAIAEIKRTLRPGGVALVTSFEKQGFIEVFQDAQKAIRPDAPLWEGPLPAEWLTETKLRAVMEGGGFQADRVEIQRQSAWLEGEVWSKPAMVSMVKGFIAMITSGWSEAERARFEEVLRQNLSSEEVRSRKYEMKGFVAVARK